MENILEIESLCKAYKKSDFALKDVSFRLPYGYIMGLIGPNGAGKTTIIKLMMHLLLKDSGEIKIFGKDNAAEGVAIRERIGFVYDNPSLYDHLTLQHMKTLVAPFYRRWDDESFYRLARDFDLPLKQKIKTLSRGMRMKYALAIALSHHADLIIMDEPTSGLDPVFRRELLEILAGVIQDEGKSILFSTHITSDLERIADYITFIHNGQLVFSSSKDEILEKWGIVKGGNDWLNEETKGLFQGIRTSEFGFEALTPEVEKIRREFKSEVIYEKATLEDIMFFTVKGANHAKHH